MAHEVTHSSAGNRNAFSGQIVHDSPTTAGGILQVDGYEPGHDRQRGIADRDWLVVVGGSGQCKQLTLAANRELPVVWIDQLSSFMGARAAEIFFKPLQLHLEFANLLEQLSFLGLALVLGLRFLSAGEQLTGTLQ